MSRPRLALVCSVVLMACAPAELSGSDRADSGARLDASVQGDTAPMGDTGSSADAADALGPTDGAAATCPPCGLNSSTVGNCCLQ
jgi:hypothetical protein